MVNIRYANAMAEVLQYLKGIRQEDIDKIPRKFMIFLEENASKDYECQFDYTKPLKELELLDETRGIIGIICLNYWCDTQQQRNKFLNKINENEIKYQEELKKKYNPDNIFKNRQQEMMENNISESSIDKIETNLIQYKETIIQRILKKIKKLFKK